MRVNFRVVFFAIFLAALLTINYLHKVSIINLTWHFILVSIITLIYVIFENNRKKNSDNIL